MSGDELMTDRISEGSRPVAGSVVTGWSERFWKMQACGLVLLAGSSFFPPLYHLQEYLFFALFILAVGWVLKNEPTMPWVRTTLDLPVLCFVLWVLCSVPFSTDPLYSLSEWRKFIAQILVLYWGLLVYRWHGPHKLAQNVLMGIVLGSALLSAYAVTDFLMRGGTWRDRYVRAVAPGSDYNWLSTYMVLAIPVVVSLLLTERSRLGRISNGAILILSIVAQAASYTRAGWLGHMAQAFSLGLLTNRRKHLLLVLAFVGAVAVSLLLLAQAGFQKDTVDRWTLASRISVWKLGLHDISEHPFVGIGYGNNTFVKRHPEYSVETQASIREQNRVPPAMHSAFLMVTLGSGIPAGVFFTWMFVRIVRLLIPGLGLYLSAPPMVLALGAGVGVIGFAVRNLFDYMFMGSLSHLFWILVATGVALRQPQLLRHKS